MKYKTILNSIKDFLVRLTDVLVPVVSVALLLGIIFGPEAPFVGDVYKNISDLLNLIGSDGLLWWLWVELNHRPQRYECCALTI